MDLQKVMKENKIKTHEELQRYLAKISGGKHYWQYGIEAKGFLEATKLMEHFELITLEGVGMYYETREF